MGAVVSCFHAIGDCIMTVINAIAGVIMAIVNGVVAVLKAIVSFLTSVALVALLQDGEVISEEPAEYKMREAAPFGW